MAPGCTLKSTEKNSFNHTVGIFAEAGMTANYLNINREQSYQHLISHHQISFSKLPSFGGNVIFILKWHRHQYGIRTHTHTYKRTCLYKIWMKPSLFIVVDSRGNVLLQVRWAIDNNNNTETLTHYIVPVSNDNRIFSDPELILFTKT